jgi:hypothetical protein
MLKLNKFLTAITKRLQFIKLNVICYYYRYKSFMVFNKMEIKGNNGSVDAGRNTCIAPNTNTEVGSEFHINNLAVLYYVMCDFVCMFMWV